MDTDRPPHRCASNSATTTTTTTSSELFICFTSRLSSSSSMKISSKSILSPGRARDSSQISLSTSLSRRLRSSGSMKGGGQASPMFPATNGKKRGCGSFENPEPSSPKVTCIGQVRVKTKKQGKKMRGRSKSGRREVSFRKIDQTAGGDGNHFHQFQQQEQRNQRWVHLPVTICEALRAFGAEFNCFLPCRSSCMANNNQRDKEEERGSNGGGGSGTSSTSTCGAVFARWLVAEKIELVVGEREKAEEEDEDEDDMMPRRSQRRHVFEDIVIEEAEKNHILEDKQEEGRVSICVPPKNALLLMRCRSDPVKMAALANRFWECPPPPDEDDEENENENGGLVEEESHQDEQMEQQHIEDVVVCEKLDSCSHHDIQIPEVDVEVEPKAEPEVLLDGAEVKQEEEGTAEPEVLLDREEVKQEEDNQLVEVQVEGDLQKQDQEEDRGEEEKETLEQAVLEDETFESASSPETFADPENEGKNEDSVENEAETAPKQENEEAFDEESERELEGIVAEESTEEKTQTLEKMLHEEKNEEEQTVTTTHERSEPQEAEKTLEPETGQEESKERESENILPDCLLLMMCEPKLSMEVSKETWVCSTDFIRWHPPEKKPPPQPQPQPQPLPKHQHQIIVNKTDGCDQPKQRVSIDLPLAPRNQIMQPPRSSCSFPAAPPLAPAHGAQSINTMVEQKLVGAAKHSYEPFVLTRCKSEPMRSSAKLAPEACFWKNRKLEPHRPAATLGVGAAGVGF